MQIGQSLGIELDRSLSYDQDYKFKAKFSLPDDDMIADIYQNDDPIEASLKMRWAYSAGFISEEIRLRHHVDRHDQYFFKLTLKS